MFTGMACIVLPLAFASMATQYPVSSQQHHKLRLQPVIPSAVCKGSCFYPTARQSMKIISYYPKVNPIHLV